MSFVGPKHNTRPTAAEATEVPFVWPHHFKEDLMGFLRMRSRSEATQMGPPLLQRPQGEYHG